MDPGSLHYTSRDFTNALRIINSKTDRWEDDGQSRTAPKINMCFYEDVSTKSSTGFSQSPPPPTPSAHVPTAALFRDLEQLRRMRTCMGSGPRRRPNCPLHGQTAVYWDKNTKGERDPAERYCYLNTAKYS